ncbi:MAG TPA: alanine racemase [Kofleriaceae bacterium]|nr:alanine racemase [Kofleriaceae bacterium]
MAGPASIAASQAPVPGGRGGIRPTRIEVDLGAVIENARAVKALAATRLYAVVKADAYGHGAPQVARALDASGACDGLCVSLVEEGAQLRDAGVRGPILVMGPSQAHGEDEMIARGLTPVVSDPDDVARIAAAAAARGASVSVHVKIDTGMHRLGIAPSDAARVASDARARGLTVAGLMTHFANADIDDPADLGCMTYAQLASFAQVDAVVRAPIRHAANSSGAMMFPSARLDLVRTGIAIYGNGRWPADARLNAPRRQAMRLVTDVAQLRRVPRGGTVGYGALWRADRDTIVAVLPLGYADGLPRRATSHARVLIRGKRCPLVGAISMDIAIADVTDVPEAQVADEVVLLGEQGSDTITTAEYGAWSGLTEYEVTCGMSKRVPRVHVGGAGG